LWGNANMTSEQYKEIKIFIASPGDVIEQRQTVRRVVEEENNNHFKHNGYEIKVVGWETHSTPGKAKKHPQELINPLIDDCALFIGVLWTKFGSPTADYESGTEEEYYHALELLDNPGLPLCDILIYFCRFPVDPYVPDHDQFAKVASFRKTVSEKHKILYWDVNKKEQFEPEFRRHLCEWFWKYIGGGEGMRLNAEPLELEKSLKEGLSEKFETMSKGF